MKNSNEWVRQALVDKTADAMIASGKATLETINAYQVAKAIGCEANSSLYAKFRDWRHRRAQEAAPATIDVPPEAEAEIKAFYARQSDEGVATSLRWMKVVGSDVSRVAALHTAAAERRADVAEAEVEEVLALGQATDAELQAAWRRIGALEKELADAQRREDRILGRLEQREADLAAALRQRQPEATTGIDDPIVTTDGEDALGDAEADVSSAPPPFVERVGERAQLRLTFQPTSSNAEAGHDHAA